MNWQFTITDEELRFDLHEKTGRWPRNEEIGLLVAELDEKLAMTVDFAVQEFAAEMERK